MFTTHPPWRHHFNHMGGHLPIEDHVALPRSCQAPRHAHFWIFPSEIEIRDRRFGNFPTDIRIIEQRLGNFFNI